ncbi:hypothetical protein QBD00_003231 [Ochrobactrum sp. AN78]|nr:hypothetical protein [Ochrobactrum sp. AN78]
MAIMQCGGENRLLILAVLDTASPTGSFTGPVGAYPW